MDEPVTKKRHINVIHDVEQFAMVTNRSSSDCDNN